MSLSLNEGSYAFLHARKGDVLDAIFPLFQKDLPFLKPHVLETGGFANLIFVESDGEITLEELDPAFHFLQTTPTFPTYKVCVILDADRMNRFCQNKLLKVLEEPPRKTLIILVTPSFYRLIPTIRSRLKIISFSKKEKDATVPTETLKNIARLAFKKELKTNTLKDLVKNYSHQVIMEETLAFLFESIKKEVSQKMLTVYQKGFDFMKGASDAHLDPLFCIASFFETLSTHWNAKKPIHDDYDDLLD